MFNAFYAQSGGVTAVINASACAVIETAKKYPDKINKVLIGKNGILGAIHNQLYDTSVETAAAIAGLKYTPGGAFGSCRHKLGDPDKNLAEYEALFRTFAAHDIRYFFYNGGGDSQDTALKVLQMSQRLAYPLVCIGIPKTVDNDLPVTDNSPGFGSVAKYVAVAIREAGLDVASMAETSTKVFILEVMGRHAGWIAAASGLASEEQHPAPHMILFPERPFDKTDFLMAVKRTVEKAGYCTIVASEGIRDKTGAFLSALGASDAFGHAQLGGVAPVLAHFIKEKWGYKYHWAVADYLQRSARHIAAQVDVDQAYAVGEKAVQFAMEGKNGVLPVIRRLSDQPYRWDITEAPLSAVANIEKKLPDDFIREDGYHITMKAKRYLEPLIQGEAYPPYHMGLPAYTHLSLALLGNV